MWNITYFQYMIFLVIWPKRFFRMRWVYQIRDWYKTWFLIKKVFSIRYTFFFVRSINFFKICGHSSLSNFYVFKICCRKSFWGNFSVMKELGNSFFELSVSFWKILIDMTFWIWDVSYQWNSVWSLNETSEPCPISNPNKFDVGQFN